MSSPSGKCLLTLKPTPGSSTAMSASGSATRIFSRTARGSKVTMSMTV